MQGHAGRAVLILLASMLLAPPFEAAAQQLEPRNYANIPVGMNFLVAGYGYTEGSVTTEAASPIQDAEVQAHTAIFGYARSFGLWGTSGKFDIVDAEVWISGQAKQNGQPRSRDVSGLADPQFRASINLYGAPAITMSEVTNYHQNVIIGMSFAVTAPLGRYDSGKLLNIGNNRWSFKPEFGISKAFGRLTLELTPAVTIYTDNDDFLGKVKEQDPLYSMQTHVIYSFRRGFWGAVSATYYTGGSTTLQGVGQHDLQEHFRVGATFSVPLGKRESIKFYGSTGAWSRAGGDYWLAGLAFQYRWGGGL